VRGRNVCVTGKLRARGAIGRMESHIAKRPGDTRMTQHPQTPDRDTLIDLVQRMSEDELRFFNRLIVDRLKLLDQAHATVTLSQFNVGDRVGFTSRDGERKAGTIARLNKKTATILTDDHQRWNVSPQFLQALRCAQRADRRER